MLRIRSGPFKSIFRLLRERICRLRTHFGQSTLSYICEHVQLLNSTQCPRTSNCRFYCCSVHYFYLVLETCDGVSERTRCFVLHVNSVQCFEDMARNKCRSTGRFEEVANIFNLFTNKKLIAFYCGLASYCIGTAGRLQNKSRIKLLLLSSATNPV